MPSYWRLKYVKPASEKRRIITNLEKLRKQLANELPQKTAEHTLLLGTWNIRNFDDNRFKNGPRLDESMWYIAEIISAFNILAVQEVCEDLKPLDEVMKLLDPAYDYIITDLRAELLGGELKAADDAAEARWVAPEDLAELPATRTTLWLLKERLGFG